MVVDWKGKVLGLGAPPAKEIRDGGDCCCSSALYRWRETRWGSHTGVEIQIIRLTDVVVSLPVQKPSELRDNRVFKADTDRFELYLLLICFNNKKNMHNQKRTSYSENYKGNLYIHNFTCIMQHFSDWNFWTSQSNLVFVLVPCTLKIAKNQAWITKRGCWKSGHTVCFQLVCGNKMDILQFVPLKPYIKGFVSELDTKWKSGSL